MNNRDILKEIEHVIDKEGRQTNINDIIKETDYVGLYFAGSWCQHCLLFTPLLLESYNKFIKLEKSFEVILVSVDDSSQAFKE